MYKFKNYNHSIPPPQEVLVYPKIKVLASLLLGMLLTGIFAHFMIKSGVYRNDLGAVTLGTVAAMITCALFYSFAFQIKFYHLKGKEIMVRSLWGNKLKALVLADIEAYHSANDDLILLVKDKRVYISERVYENVPKLEVEISFRRKDEKSLGEQRKKEIYSIWMPVVILILGISLVSGSMVKALVAYVVQPKMVSITGILAEKPVLRLRKQNDRTTQYGLIVYIKEYPDFTFEVDKASFRYCNADAFVRSHHEGDAIAILVREDQYKNLLHAKRGSKEGFFSSSVLTIFDLRDDQEVYLSIDDYDAHRAASNRMEFWFYTLIGGGMILGALFVLRKSL